MKRIKAAAMMACTVTALALTACSGQETAEDPRRLCRLTVLPIRYREMPPGQTVRRIQRKEMLQRELPETVS